MELEGRDEKRMMSCLFGAAWGKKRVSFQGYLLDGIAVVIPEENIRFSGLSAAFEEVHVFPSFSRLNPFRL